MRTKGSRTKASALKAWTGLLVFLIVALAAAMVTASPHAARAAGLEDPIPIATPAPGEKPEAPRITAKAAALMDMETGTLLYSRNGDKQLEMASTTKIMTAVLILESLPLDKVVSVPGAAVGVAGSSLGLKRGEKFTVEQLLYAMLVPSANDAAITLAVAEAGSVKAFVAKMNERAQKMGLTNTHFANPNGLHVEEGHYSSAKDMAKLSAYAMRDPVFRRIVATREYTLPHAGGTAPRVIKTSNELLAHEAWVNGIKTGSTDWADYCLVSSATQDGMTVISVVLGAKDQDTREAESKALLRYGLKRSWNQDFVDEGQLIADVSAPDPLGRNVGLVTAEAYSRRLFDDQEIVGQVVLSRELTLPVKAGEVLGKLEFFQGQTDLGSVPLVAAESVEVADLKTILGHWFGPWAQGLPLTRFLAFGSG